MTDWPDSAANGQSLGQFEWDCRSDYLYINERSRILPGSPGPVWGNGVRVLLTPADVGRTDVVSSSPGTEHRSLICYLCPGRRSLAEHMRQQKSKVCSLTHDFPTFAGAAALTQPETLCMLSIINCLWWNLLFKQRSSVLKQKYLIDLGHFYRTFSVENFLIFSPWTHKASVASGDRRT